ncbi:MAG: hypothetical protein AAGB51_14665 [Planctomycetota bacterium]
MNVLLAILAVVGAVLGVGLAVFLFVKLIGLLGKAIVHIFRFLGGEIGDAFRALGALLLVVLYVPMVLGNIIIGRWSAASHFGTAIKSEFGAVGNCCYRMLIGHPARLLFLTSFTEGLERRLPEVMANAPTRDRPRSKSTGTFDGYTITGSLTAGGSGGKLYVAQPDEVKLAGFARNGQQDVDRVVIKTFNLKDGSSLPQIVRERRALDAAKKLGLVLEHDLTEERFYYVMRYVPGEPLGAVTTKLHNQAGPEGLDGRRLKQGLTYVADLLETLGTYHSGGLWHKDVKPDNIIIHDERAHLVDLGLVSELRSAMTLTTHGTEYFRDPELVRMALKGVKVNQVDGGKFDIYAAGAVLFSIIENSFPAHGGLSQVTRRCPESLRWVIRRSMAEYDQRYTTTGAMLADVNAVLAAEDPFTVRPADLPSMKVAGNIPEIDDPNRAPAPGVAQAAAYQAANAGPVGGMPHNPQAPERKPGALESLGRSVDEAVQGKGGSFVKVYGLGDEDKKEAKGEKGKRFRVTNWWTGGYVAEDEAARARHTPVPPAAARPVVEPDAAPARQLTPVAARRPAQEQVASARARAAALRERAQARREQRRPGAAATRGKNPGDVNGGVMAALMLLTIFVGIGAVKVLNGSGDGDRKIMVIGPDGSEIAAPPLVTTAEATSDSADEALEQAMAAVQELFDRAVALPEDGSDRKLYLEAAAALTSELDSLADFAQSLADPVTQSAMTAEARARGAQGENIWEIVDHGGAIFVGDLLDGYDVVLISEFTPPLDPEIAGGLEHCRGIFEAHGANIDESVDSAATLKLIKGEAPLDGKYTDFAEPIHGWIDDRDEPTLVVWIEPKVNETNYKKAPDVVAAVFSDGDSKVWSLGRHFEMSEAAEDVATEALKLVLN